LLAIGLTSGTPNSVAQRSYSALLRVLTLTRPGEQPESRDARVGAANVMAPNWPHSVRRIRCHAEKSSKGRLGSLLVEAEAVSDRGRVPATGDPQLGEDPRDVDASRLGGNEQGLADLPVGLALGDQHKHLQLTLG
jgi:hypothetical protein